MALDDAGALWIASYQGLYRVHEGRAEVFTEAEGLSSSWISDLLIDSDGVLWCATEAGLDKLSHPAFVNYTSRADLPVNAVWAMEELRDGSVWLGTNNGIVVIDTAGHATGDAALRALASRGKSVIRNTDVLSRWGGDECALLMPETDQTTAVSICARLKSAVEARSSTDDVPAFTISGGVATVTSLGDPVTAVDLLERADTALYRAKEGGRDAIMHEMDGHLAVS